MTKQAELKGSSYTLSALHLSNEDIQQATDYLKEKVNQAPNFFAAAPIVIDVSNAGTNIDFKELKNGVTEAGMIPVGVSGCKNALMQQQARDAGFALMNAAKQAQAAKPVVEPTRIIDTPVRSGQQIYAKNCDLVVMSNVSPGAEIIADGCIHVFGALRGRAIAGANGQQQARIFCHNLQPELVSIDGKFWLSDKIPDKHWGKGAVISLAENNLNIEPLAL
ncbi:septum formation inhibitor [Photobacterium jeanii]|uniref:Probable septum site-determining protein MinC n=1 Tax=Photobacterium jeanii TaxID=858640 RepID=A0A178KMQ0_9GAMM|nr:septum site-determining protein MinC [Photobacterium jeanii]OAN18470.1 septum formation inhibitor [Photobacterium jeanii]PST91848.1 septum site-determining protein MinC [Photobacterium jeanii]